MTKIRRFALTALGLCVSIAGLSSCVPYINSYFLPEAREGHRTAYSCGTMMAGSETVWEVNRDVVRLGFLADRTEPGNTRFVVVVNVTSKANIELERMTGAYRVRVNGSEYGFNTIMGIRGTYGTSRNSSVVLDGSKIALWPRDFFEFHVSITDTTSDHYAVQWPPVIVNGTKYELPEINFSWKHGVAVTFINC